MGNMSNGKLLEVKDLCVSFFTHAGVVKAVDGVSFNVYVYNNQPGVIINYADGTSHLPGEEPSDNVSGGKQSPSGASVTQYVINTNNKKVHLPSCGSVKNIKAENKKTVKDSLNHLMEEGYTPCGTCLPQAS